MITLHWYNDTFTAEKAVRSSDWIRLHDNSGKETALIAGIKLKDWSHITLDGEWSDPSEIPTEAERLQADVDFLTMENEYLEGESAQARADIDYLLMITEEE